MPCLLTLPREIRDGILELVVCNERAPPQNPTAASSDRTLLDVLERRSWSYASQYIKYEGQGSNGAYTTNSLSLLLANHQLSSETQDVLERLSTTYSYGLDVMLVDEKELWPTWVSVPALSTQVDSVVATFRIFGTWGGEGRFAFGIGCGPPEIVWCFYSLMERFLTCGPVGERKLPSPDRKITVKFLILNILTPLGLEPVATDDLQTYGQWYRSRIDRYRVSDDVEDDAAGAARAAGTNIPMQPAWLANFLHGYICDLLDMGYHTASAGAIMYERIGTIRICVDGELRHEYGLGEYLARLRFTDAGQTFGNVYPRENRLPFFWQWKKKALKMRKEAGLPIGELEDPELLQP